MDSLGRSEIVLDEEGVCNFCLEYEEKGKLRIVESDQREDALRKVVEKLKKAGKGAQYDCLIGVSGGTDSTYVAYLVKELGLRPLAVHFDNGWNSELAVSNIEKILDVLGIELYTEVIEWKMFKDLQLSFLKASTPDGEIPTDHAILATLYKIASKFNIKYIISGNNFKTEGVMPLNWAYGHIDWKYIKGVHKKFGTASLKNFPHITFPNLFYYSLIKRVKLLSILNYIDYDKREVVDVLENKLGWRNYGGKHYESKYTKIYQGHILPEKFFIDKRKIHLSALILSNQMTREEALEELKKPTYPLEELDFDIEYLSKKLEISENEFELIMEDEPKLFRSYSNSFEFIARLKSLVTSLRSKGILPK